MHQLQALNQLCLHDCYILGQGGKFWPQPTFRIVAADQASKPVDGRSATGAWNAILARINDNINRRCRNNDPPHLRLRHAFVADVCQCLGTQVLSSHAMSRLEASNVVHTDSVNVLGPSASNAATISLHVCCGRLTACGRS